MKKKYIEDRELKYLAGAKFEKDVKIEVEILKVKPFVELEDFQYWCQVSAGSWSDMTWYTEEELDELHQVCKLKPQAGEIWKCEIPESDINSEFGFDEASEHPLIRLRHGWKMGGRLWADCDSDCPIPICRLVEEEEE